MGRHLRLAVSFLLQKSRPHHKLGDETDSPPGCCSWGSRDLARDAVVPSRSQAPAAVAVGGVARPVMAAAAARTGCGAGSEDGRSAAVAASGTRAAPAGKLAAGLEPREPSCSGDLDRGQLDVGAAARRNSMRAGANRCRRSHRSLKAQSHTLRAPAVVAEGRTTGDDQSDWCRTAAAGDVGAAWWPPAAQVEGAEGGILVPSLLSGIRESALHEEG